MLHKRGVTAAVRIGVRRVADGIEGHAWLEVGDFVIDGSGRHDAFAALVRLDGANEMLPL
jgi:hypothetical protein